MAQVCPLLFRQIDATVVRNGSVFVIITVILFLLTAQVALLYLLSVDFLIRLYGHKPYSPIYQLSVGVKHLFKMKTKMADAGAKRLAAQFGLFFVLLLIASYHLHLFIFMSAVALVFLLCASMELLFSYCVGCKVYYLIKKIYPKF